MKADPHQQNKYSIFARMSISWKLFTAATVIIAIIAGFIFYYFPLKLEEKASQELQTKAKTVAKMLAHTVSPALVFEDTASALEALEPALQAQGLEFAVITNHKREFFSGYKPEMGSRLAQQ